MADEKYTGPMTYDSTYRLTPMSGAEDWRHVTTMDAGAGYDWDEARFYYSPSARRFFWARDSGCSCNCWEDSIHLVSDFEDGDRGAALAAVRRIAESMGDLPAVDAIDAADAIRTFKTKEN